MPDSLPADGTIDDGSVKRFKREYEDDVFAKVRSSRGGGSVPVSELRDEWQRLLLPTRGSVHAEGAESAALAAGAEVPDVPPLYLGACCGSEAAQQLLTRELTTTIAKADWHELWVLLGQITACIQLLPRSDAVRPWWVRQVPQAGGGSEVAERVDVAARELPGGIDAPLSVETAAGTSAVVKTEVGDGLVYAQRMLDAMQSTGSGQARDDAADALSSLEAVTLAKSIPHMVQMFDSDDGGVLARIVHRLLPRLDPATLAQHADALSQMINCGKENGERYALEAMALLPQPVLQVYADEVCAKLGSGMGFVPRAAAMTLGKLDPAWLAASGHISTAELKEEEEEEGRTALMHAAAGGHTETVTALLAAPGLEVNAANGLGGTALMHAAVEGHTETVTALLAASGLEVNAAGGDGRTALMLAEGQGYVAIASLLRARRIRSQ